MATLGAVNTKYGFWAKHESQSPCFDLSGAKQLDFAMSATEAEMHMTRGLATKKLLFRILVSSLTGFIC